MAIKDLKIDEVLSQLESVGRDDLVAGYKRAAKQRNELNPMDISNTTTPDLAPDNADRFNNAKQNVTSSAFDFQNYLKKLGSGEATQDDILQAEASRTQTFLDMLDTGESKAARKKELAEEADVTGLNTQMSEYESQLEAEQRSLEIAKRELQKNPEGVSGPGALQAQINRVERQSLQKQADIAILGNAAARRLDTAYNNIDYKLELEFGEQEENLTKFSKQLEAIEGLEESVEQRIKDQLAEQKEELANQKLWKKEIMGLAIEAQKADNPALARQFMTMANGEVSQETLDQAYSQAINGGVYSPKSKTSNLINEEIGGAILAIEREELTEQAAINSLVATYPEYRDEIIEKIQNRDVYSTLLGDVTLPGESGVDDFDYSLTAGEATRNVANRFGQAAGFFMGPRVSRATGNESSFAESVVNFGRNFFK